MGQLLHKCARTTEKTRREIQLSKESIATLARQYGVNRKTIAKWKNRTSCQDVPMGPKVRRSKVLTEQEEEVVIAFRKLTQLPLDDCLYSLQETIPHLSRSTLHRCFQRHGCPKLEKGQSKEKTAKKHFKAYPIGYFHIDIAEVQTAQGKLYLFVGIDRTSKFCYARLYEFASKSAAVGFLQDLIAFVPYKIHKILTDNGVQFTNRKEGELALEHMFDRICEQEGIIHRRTQVAHPWTNGQIERMNRTIKQATVQSYYYSSHEQLECHLNDFLLAYNFARRLKALRGKTPWQFIEQQWQKNPHFFHQNIIAFTKGLNKLLISPFGGIPSKK
jgi:transposase-like protein